MTGAIAPPKNTGGGGFGYENEVCAWFMAAMLLGEPIFGPENGPPCRIDFQTRPDGWLLDDVLVTTGIAARTRRFAVSIKSNVQFTSTTAPPDFVDAAWAQWLRIDSPIFDKNTDYLTLVTNRLSGAARNSLFGLIEKARANDPSLFHSRLSTPGWATRQQRALFTSFGLPPSFDLEATEEDTSRLLQRLQFLEHDFGAAGSASLNQSIEMCRRSVRSQSVSDAEVLWNALKSIASELRPLAGSISRTDLIVKLRERIQLAEYPEHESAWQTLERHTSTELALVRSSIADRITISRDRELTRVLEATSSSANVILLGPSGIGKTAMAKAALQRHTDAGNRALWLDAARFESVASLAALEASLQLTHPLSELFAHEPSRNPLLVLDGLDRVYSEQGFRLAASVLQVAAGSASTLQWGVVIVCQTQDWQRVLGELQRAGGPTNRWTPLELTRLQVEDLKPVRQAVPAISRLISEPRVGGLLTNLKLLDLVVRHLESGEGESPTTWAGESSVADWFWSSEVNRGSQGLTRSKVVRWLAQVQADHLTSAVREDSLPRGLEDAAHSLIVDKLLVRTADDRLAFGHDLYGDWARLRILLSHRADLDAFLLESQESPLWHRAIRLYGIHVLERENGLAEWQSLIFAFDSDRLAIARDLLLEAPVFAMNARPLLNKVLPDLASSDGVLLQRLLRRFLTSATTPDERMEEFAKSNDLNINEFRASFRRPIWPLWPDALASIHAHRDTVIPVASDEVTGIAKLWLEYTPTGYAHRAEAADLAVLLGRRALESRPSHQTREKRQTYFVCMLLAADERPEEVSRVAIEAAKRDPVLESEAEEPESPVIRPPAWLGAGVTRGPWPEGPLANIDEAFRKAVLDSGAIYTLFRVRPAVVREVILACLIREPYEEYPGEARPFGHSLYLEDLHDWHPPLYSHGPFLECLKANFAEGLELVLQLVDFATAHALETARQQWGSEGTAVDRNGLEQVGLREAFADDVPSVLLLFDENSAQKQFLGDANVYGWIAGLGNPPQVIEVALMALEQYFYSRIERGEEITRDVARTLERSRSVAMLSVLSEVGKMQKALFDGPLRPLLSAPELYSWELGKRANGRSHLMIGASMQGYRFFELARKFHSREHRQQDLRLVATERLFASEEFQGYMAGVRAWWKKRQAVGESLIGIVDQLDLWLDPANFRIRKGAAGTQEVFNVALEERQRQNAKELQSISDSIIPLQFPVHSRQLLDEGQPQTDSILDDLWQEWSRVRELARDDSTLPNSVGYFRSGFADAIMAGVALFLWHDEWLSRDASRRHVVESTLQAFTEHLPVSDESYVNRNVATWTWQCFLSDAAVMLWARDSSDRTSRRLVAECVFLEQYEAVRQLFSRCADYRSTLGEDFKRLRRLAFDWAHIRRRIETSRSPWHATPPVHAQKLERQDTALQKWCTDSIESFIEGTLIPEIGDWTQVDDDLLFLNTESMRPKLQSYQRLDFQLVRSSNEWIPLPNEAIDPTERASIIHFWQVALGYITERPNADLPKRARLFPNDDERWVLDSVAGVVLQLLPTENAEALWKPIIELNHEAHDWSEIFLVALHRRALALEQVPQFYSSIIERINQHAQVSLEGRRRWSSHEAVWDALIGIDRFTNSTWEKRHSAYVTAIWPTVTKWMELAPQTEERLGRFARWLARPAAAGNRLATLSWFHQKIQSAVGFSPAHLGDDLARLLNAVWDEEQSQLRSWDEAFSSFRGLLAWLVRNQNIFGLELQSRIGSLS